MNSLFRGKHRAAAFGVGGAVMAGAAAIGPLAGGLLTEYAGWRWIFWVNVPIALALIALRVRLVPETKGEPSSGRDLPGFALSARGFGLLVFAIIEGPRLGWTSWPALAGAMLAVGMAASSRGFTGQVAQVADAARASAGASISAMRDAGIPGDVLAPVVGAFADGTRLALVSAVAALAIGLVGAVMVGRSARAGAPADGRGDEEGR